jgi:hypothetical protein
LANKNLLLVSTNETPNPKKLNYCGYKCPDKCEFREASIKNDAQLKKEAYNAWKIDERYGIKFEADKIFCFGCKNRDKPEGVVLTNCTARSCAIEKNFDSCIECNELSKCDKDLWIRFPSFHEKVVELQKIYIQSKG